MTDSSEAWTDGPGEMRPCILCKSRTKSHSVYAEVGQVAMTITPASEEESTHKFTVCHSCYDEYDPSELLAEFDAEVSQRATERNMSPSELLDVLDEEGSRTYGRGTEYTGSDEIRELVVEEGFESGTALSINGNGPWIVADFDKPKLNDQLTTTHIYVDLKWHDETVPLNKKYASIIEGVRYDDDHLYLAFLARDMRNLDFDKIETLVVHE